MLRVCRERGVEGVESKRMVEVGEGGDKEEREQRREGRREQMKKKDEPLPTKSLTPPCRRATISAPCRPSPSRSRAP